ncbi:MAG: hypothetical protein AAGU75_10015, partial [Bacillota bacterium]
MMKTWNRDLKVRDKILIYILPFIIITLLMVTLLSYFLAKQIFLTNYYNQREQVEDHVVNALHLIDAGYTMLEKELQSEMGREILEFKQQFEKAGGNPDKISLDAIKSNMGEKYDLIIIDSSTTIIKSTVPEAMDFNFMEFDKTLGEKINRIRLSDTIQYERIRTNVGTGYLNMFTYMPASDHKYLLEIAYSQGELQHIVERLDPLMVTKQVAKLDPDIKSIRIFDVYGYEFVNSGTNYLPTKESLQIVERAKKEKQFEVKTEDSTRKYLFIDLKSESTLSDSS